MLLPFFNGLLEGVVISLLLFGPAFFKLLNVSMQSGKFKGWWLATGVVLSDFVVVLLLIYGLSGLFENVYFEQLYSLGAGIAMIVLGMKYVKSSYRLFLQSYRERTKGGKSLLSGFSLNLINPFTFVLWFNVLGAISLKYSSGNDYRTNLILNLLGILLMLYLMDILKVVTADFIGRKIGHRTFYHLNRYFGGVFIIIGLVFIFSFFKLIFL
ncbi:MAG: LysE family transporter [Bacteroidetes bacterium]|nr:LysE family transporter [Bacteroidota bacterium]